MVESDRIGDRHRAVRGSGFGVRGSGFGDSEFGVSGFGNTHVCSRWSHS
jgi:hypothetical protein